MANGDKSTPQEILANLQALKDDAISGVVEKGQGFYYRDTPGQYVGSGLSPSQKIILNDEQFGFEIQRILGDESIRRDLAVDLYRDRSIYNAAGMETDSTVASGLLNSVAKYKASEDFGKVSYLDWLADRASRGRPAPGEDGSGGRYSGPVTTTSTTITDENTAEALLDKYARDLLGRGLTKKETQKYIKDFNKAEAGAPQVTTSAGTGAVRTSTTETAASKEELLREVVSKNPDFAKYQVDTTIMDMLMDDIQKAKVMING